MKIKEIRTIPLHAREPFGGWTDNIEDNIHTLVQVITESGVTGLGSVYTSEALVKGSLGILKNYYVGENACEPQRVSEKLHQSTFWQGRGGAVTHTISGIDMALWDVFGKVCSQPVSRLLGGCYRDKVRIYASIMFDEPEPLKQQLLGLTARGFRSIKLGWYTFGRKDRKNDEAMVRAAREAVGSEIELMVDAGGSEQFYANDLKWALETAKMLAHYDIAWFEEALPPDNMDDYINLRRLSSVRISGGEVLTRRQDMMRFVQFGAFDIIQPDNTKCGGLSETIQVGRYANDKGIKLIAHGWHTAVGLGADLALAAALPLTNRVEFITPSPFVEGIMAERITIDADGCIRIPQEPGLGIKLNADAIEKLSGMRLDVL